MAYGAALDKAWCELENLSTQDVCQVQFLGDDYKVTLKDKSVLQSSSNSPAKDYLAIILLHYLAGSLKNGFSPRGEWVSFKDIAGGDIYYPAFRKGAIEPILQRYGRSPDDLLKTASRFSAKRIASDGIAVELTAFADIHIRIILWRGDEEFGPDATILFDKEITRIFSMEDIAVLSNIVSRTLCLG